MQPIQHLLLLTHSRPPLSIHALSVPQSSLSAIGITLAVIRLLPATSNEQHVTNFDVAALSCGADVDSLVLAALKELFPRDGVVVERVIVDAFLVGVATVVEEDAAACDAVLGPVVDGTFVISCRAGDVCTFGLG